MDNRFPFFNQPERREIAPEPEPKSVTPPVEEVVVPPVRKSNNWLSGMLRSPNLGLFVLIALAFFMGNQVGCAWQKKQGISRQIRDLDKRHRETLRKADSLYVASLRIDSAAVKQLGTFCGQLGQLNIKDNALKTSILKTEQVVKKQSEDISTKIRQHETEVINRPKELNEFGFSDDEDN